MGRIGKPQKKKKNKIKKYGWYKNNETVNRAPKSYEQEVPRRLKELGIAIKEAQSGISNRNRNKFKNRPDGPSNDKPPPKKNKSDLKLKKIPGQFEEPGKKKMGKKMQRLTKEATETYIDNLKPTRPLLENFQFKQSKRETDKQFLRRVDREATHAVTKSQIADQFDTTEEDKVMSIVKAKLVTQKREKKAKQNLEDEQEMTTTVENQKDDKKKEFTDMKTLQDDFVAFGEVVHAPPVLSVLPKKAKSLGHDRPGLRMPELKQAFTKKTPNTVQDPVRRKKGETVKRKNLTLQQQFETDAKRESFIEAYRQMKKKRKLEK